MTAPTGASAATTPRTTASTEANSRGGGNPAPLEVVVAKKKANPLTKRITKQERENAIHRLNNRKGENFPALSGEAREEVIKAEVMLGRQLQALNRAMSDALFGRKR